MSEILKPTPEQLAEILAQHKLWYEGNAKGKRANLSRADLREANLTWANLSRADLSRANLSRADLSRANLSRADLTWANLSRADLTWANLTWANLSRADLSRANLSRADLSRADLSGANLSGANLSGADLRESNLRESNLPMGERWEKYLAEVLPQLLIAGGKTIDRIIESGCWECHVWADCPMHEAFGISSECEGPALLRPRIREFVQLFDAKLIAVEKDANGKWIFVSAVKPIGTTK